MKKFNSIKASSLFYGFLLWFFVQIPISILSANYFLKRDIQEELKRRSEITRVLSENFSSQARYGEFLQAAKNIDSLAKTNGLIQVGICKNGVDVRGIFLRELCLHNKNTTSKMITASGIDIELVYNWKELQSLSSRETLTNLLYSIFFGFLIIFGSIIILSVLVSREISNVSLHLSKITDESKLNEMDNQKSEMKPLIVALSGALKRLSYSNRNYFELKYKHEMELKRLKLARQVAHDIRSPLSCLDTIAKKSKYLSVKEAQLISDSIKRINEVAEDLLNKERKKSADINRLADEVSASNLEACFSNQASINVSQLIANSIELKAIEYSKIKNLKIASNIEPEAQSLALKIEPKEFRRVLSNIINNAVEALNPNQPGFVLTNLSKEEDQLILEIRDNGQGISEQNLEKILNEGASLGKSDGNGLGLSYARKVIESINGKLQVFSRKGLGTTVRITLPI